MKPVVRNVQTDHLYFYLGNDEFENIITGNKGIVGEDKADKVFKFNVEATQMINDNPVIADLIRSLKLKLDTTELLNLPLT